MKTVKQTAQKLPKIVGDVDVALCDVVGGEHQEFVMVEWPCIFF